MIDIVFRITLTKKIKFTKGTKICIILSAMREKSHER
jgi:hypothetical protein